MAENNDQGGSARFIIINPAAAYKSLQERYNMMIAAGISDPIEYQRLLNDVSYYTQRWQQMMVDDPNSAQTFNLNALVNGATQLSGSLTKSIQNAGLVQYGQQRDNFLGQDSAQTDALTRELYTLIHDQSVPLEDAVRIMLQTGRYPLDQVQKVAFMVGTPGFDPKATDPATETPLPFQPGEGGDSKFKPFKPVANDITSPQDEFQAGFASFTRQLETSGSASGRAPNLATLSVNYQKLFNKYLGEIELRKGRGEEDANVFKEEFINIGKNTDPQFDIETDQMQLVTKRPKLSVLDFLAQNVDPEDIYTSTEPSDRPGRSQGGFRGYVRRLAR